MIHLKGVGKRFGAHRVLHDVDLDVDAGDRIALVGSNGAGKTTLIRCMLGEYNCDGRLDIGGKNPRIHRREVLNLIGFVPQLPPPLKMPVGQLVRFAAKVCDADPNAMKEVAMRLGFDIKRFVHQPFVKLSGGQKQKLLISIAFGRKLKLLLMDEPAANLDPEARARFFELLAERQHEVTMLISSHRLDEVAPLVNRVVEMDQGRVTLDDRVADDVQLTSQLAVSIRLTRQDRAFARAISAWGFVSSEEAKVWSGTVAGPDRLRFLGTLSRYAALVLSVHMDETPSLSRVVGEA
jgi:ABC-2 type transport system ATP-binding protein